MKEMRHYYSLLGLEPGASPAEIKRSYRELVSRWHPDRFAAEPGKQRLGQEKLKEINEAYRAINTWLATGGDSADAGRPASVSAFGETPVKASSWRQVSGVVRIFSFWPNLLMGLFLLAVGKLAVARYGLSTAAAGYCLQMVTIPLLFASFCNARRGSDTKLKLAYIAAILVFTFLLAMDLLHYQKELREASVDSQFDSVESAASPPTSGRHSTPYSLGKEPSSADGPYVRAFRGPPYAPAPPAQPVAPAPAAPSAPVVPFAPRAR